jgi:aminomethyltransferase
VALAVLHAARPLVIAPATVYGAAVVPAYAWDAERGQAVGRAMETNATLKRTALHAAHQKLGARLVEFGGWDMPVQYTSIVDEHLATRRAAGMFDVSHMTIVDLNGARTREFLRYLVANDVAKLTTPGKALYTGMLNEAGGVIDDLIVYFFTPTQWRLVVNAGTKEGDFEYIAEKLKGVATLTPRLDRALLALQGPKAAEVLERHSPGISQLTFMKIVRTTGAGAPAIISRTGYTGEDGFEISIEGADAQKVARALLKEVEVLPIGLGARDSLRLEAGLCLYGHDMDDSIDPAEAALMWSIGKRRREAKDFPAADKIMANAPAKKRVGIRPEGRAPAREGTEIADKTGRIIGKVTSGGFGPSLNAPLAMGYVEAAFAADGTPLDLMVRGKPLPALVTAMPFVPHTYRR